VEWWNGGMVEWWNDDVQSVAKRKSGKEKKGDWEKQNTEGWKKTTKVINR